MDAAVFYGLKHVVLVSNIEASEARLPTTSRQAYAAIEDCVRRRYISIPSVSVSCPQLSARTYFTPLFEWSHC
jgi:hypothetical protein